MVVRVSDQKFVGPPMSKDKVVQKIFEALIADLETHLQITEWSGDVFPNRDTNDATYWYPEYRWQPIGIPNTGRGSSW